MHVCVSLSEVPNCQSTYMRGGYFSNSHEGKQLKKKKSIQGSLKLLSFQAKI